MPIQKLYRVRCDCGNFLPQAGIPRSVSTSLDAGSTPLFTSHQDAVAEAMERGWSAYPLKCPPCAKELKK